MRGLQRNDRTAEEMFMGETWEQRGVGKARIWKVRYMARGTMYEIARGHKVEELLYLATVLGREAKRLPHL